MDENEEFEFRARAEQESAQPDHSNIVNKALAATVKTPFGLPPQNTQAAPAWKQGIAGIVPGLGPLADPTKSDWTPQEQDMAKSGTDITSGIPYGLMNKLSLLVDPSDKETRDVVNQHYKQDVGLARNKYGELEFTNPDTGRRTLLKAHTDTIPGMAPTAGGSMDTLGQGGGAIAAGVPTAMATGNPVLAGAAASLGAGVGQTIADSGKTVISNVLYGGAGVKAPMEQLADISKDAAKATAVTAAGEVVGGIPNLVRGFSRGFFLDLSFSRAKDFQAMSREAQAGLGDYYTLIGSQAAVKPSISELIPQNAMARIISEKAYKSTEELTAEEERRINSNLDTLSYNYKSFTDAFKPDPSFQYGSSGYNIQQEMEAKKAVALSQQQLQNSVQKADAASQIAGLPAMSETERNQELTGMLNRLKDAGEDAKNQAYGDLKVALGVPKEVAYDRTSGKWLQGRTDNDVVQLNALTRTKIQNMWEEGMKLQNSPLRSGDKYFSAIPEDFFNDVSKPELGLKDLTKPQYDILSMIDNIQDLHSGTRAAMAASKGRIPADEQASADVADALEDSVRYHLSVKGDPRILDLWEEAKQQNKQYEENFGRGIINTVMKRSGGFEDPVYNSATSGLLMRAGKGQDQSGVAKFADILKGAPDEQERVRNMIWSVYKDHYLPPSGVPDTKSFQMFKDQMEGPMKYFFTDAERAKMNTVSDMTQTLADSSKKLANFNMAWRKSPEYGGIPTTSQGLSNAVFRNSVPPQVLGKMITMIKTMQPQLYKEWQADTARQFALRTSDASGMPVDSLVGKYVDQYGPRISSVMGPDYVSNLRTYQKVANMVQGGSGVKLDPDRPQSILTQVIRAKFAAPMSEEGRWFTGLLNWRKRAAGRVVYNALKSPEGLDSFIKASQANAASPIAGGIWSQLNGSALGQSLLGNGTPPSSSSSDSTR